jgi:hypothetical protein
MNEAKGNQLFRSTDIFNKRIIQYGQEIKLNFLIVQMVSPTQLQLVEWNV